MMLAFFLPVILGIAVGYLLNELLRITKECKEIERSLKK